MSTDPSATPGTGGLSQAIVRFAHRYGWWRVIAIPVMVVITVWVCVDIARGGDAGASQAGQSQGQHSEQELADSPSSHPGAHGADGAHPDLPVGPDPASMEAVALAKDALPPGGPIAERGEGTYREVGVAGASAGKAGADVPAGVTQRTVRYAIEVENGVDTRAYGGDDAFATMVDATLMDPRGWTNDPAFRFEHVAVGDKPDTIIRLTSLGTTVELCGAQLETETSCHTTITGPSTVVVNEARWVRGAQPFEGDLGRYRQYLINHEFGHAIGYAAHQPCGAQGALAPVMMQQTLSMNNAELYAKDPEEVYPDNDLTCKPNPWPYPRPDSTDPHNLR
ncbi:DUF3152 domain-containing protein [Corynebacterium lizhenjunii]|uniref:DUF3152 domain-containing protein n=1 Tax=Corynebacterium lizhenjunii TaxID=2709394 RepID=UPI0013EC6301|nr:DUF3152 domain-containing protein [Corynebacterium lizhenjunii]